MNNIIDGETKPNRTENQTMMNQWMQKKTNDICMCVCVWIAHDHNKNTAETKNQKQKIHHNSMQIFTDVYK